MENYRLTIKNNYKNDIRLHKKLLENNQKTISNLTQQKATNFVINKVKKLGEKVKEIKSQIIILEKKIKDIDTGALDDEIEKSLLEEQKKLDEKLNIKSRRKNEETKIKSERSKISKNYYEKNRQTMRKQRYNQRGWKSCYNYYVRTSQKLPHYMKKNLSNMPNNKGYLWRDIAFYGERPPERNKPTVLFQRERDGSMIIHEWTPSHYNKYRKKTKQDRKVLFYKAARKKRS